MTILYNTGRSLKELFFGFGYFLPGKSDLRSKNTITNNLTVPSIQKTEIHHLYGIAGASEIQKLTSQNKGAILLLIFSALLVFFDPTASLIFDLPRQVLEVLTLIYVVLVPLYLIRNRPAYVIGIIVAVFVVFFFRTRIPSPSLPIVPILQYFLAFFSLLSFRQAGLRIETAEQTG
ncbi:MAG TPA: hypothetical protein VIH03_09365 [Nitrososphaerales archaeon]